MVCMRSGFASACIAATCPADRILYSHQGKPSFSYMAASGMVMIARCVGFRRPARISGPVRLPATAIGMGALRPNWRRLGGGYWWSGNVPCADLDGCRRAPRLPVLRPSSGVVDQKTAVLKAIGRDLEIVMPGEKRWLILTPDGGHVSVGRHTDPSGAEVEAVERNLREIGTGGWLVVMEGSYYASGAVTLMNVRELVPTSVSWDDAVAAFQRRRLDQRRHSRIDSPGRGI